MSKTKFSAVPVDSAPTSLKDAGYQFARVGESSISKVRYVLDRVPGFLDDVPTEVKAELFAGFQLRKHELEGEKFYKLADGGNYIPLATVPEDATGIVCMTVNVAMSYSQQEYGKMRESDPAKHAIIKPLRDAFSNYASNQMRDLKAAIRRIVNEGKPRERAANKAFRESMVAMFETYDKKVRTAKDRGDPDADQARFRTARDAFWRVYDNE